MMMQDLFMNLCVKMTALNKVFLRNVLLLNYQKNENEKTRNAHLDDCFIIWHECL